MNKYTLWAVVFVATLAAVVLLSIFAEGEHIEAVLAFAGGLLVPGSPLGRFFGDGGGPRPPSPVVAGALLVLGLAMLGGALSGCSPSALRSHRMADGVAAVAIAAGRSTLDTVGSELVAACDGDDACEAERSERLELARESFSLLDAARGAYHVAIDVAREVGEGDFLGAVGEAARGLVLAWYQVRAFVCATLGYELPEAPRIVLDAVAWASGEALPALPSCVLPPVE